MTNVDLAVNSVTVNAGPYTFTGNNTNYLYSMSGLTFSSYTPSPPVPATPENWLRQRVKEVCELAAA